MLKKLIRNRKGQGLVEYALIIAGVTLVCAVGISVFGHKLAGMLDTVVAIMPGAHAGCNAPIEAGALIEFTQEDGHVVLDTDAIAAASGTERLSQNLWGTDTGDMLAPGTGE